MSKEHKHAELIKAWADGAEIQMSDNAEEPEWYNDTRPSWYSDYLYRIKPKAEDKWQRDIDVGNRIDNALKEN